MPPAESALILCHRAESIPRSDDAWERQRDIRSELIGIDLVGTSPLSRDGLPLMRTMEVDIQLLSTPEGIALGQTHHQLRTYPSGSLALGVGFYIEIVWFVEHQIDVGIQSIAILHISQTVQNLSASRHKLQVGITEESHRLQSCLSRIFIIHHIKFSWSELQLPEHHSGTNRHLLTRISETQITAHKAIGHLLHELLLEVDVDIADIPLSGCFRLNAVHHRQTEVHLARRIHGICKIRSIAILIEVIAMVAEKTGESLTLLLQIGNIKRTSLSDDSLRHRRIDELLAMFREIEISHGIQSPQMSHIHLISHLGFLRIALGEHFVIYLAIEIAQLVELMLSYLCSQLRIHILHQLRLRTEHLGNPSGKSIIRRREGIPYP